MSASVTVLTGLSDREGLVGRDGEVRADLDVHLEGHRPVVRQLDRLDVEVGLGDRVELVILVDLLQAGHQERRLDLAGDLLAEPLLDELPGRVAGAEARDRRLAGHLAERVLELLLDVGPGDRDLDVLLAGADVADLDVEASRAWSRPWRRSRHRPWRASRNALHRCSSTAVLRIYRPGWPGSPSRTRRDRAKATRRFAGEKWSGRWDLNPRQPRWQRGALPLSYSRPEPAGWTIVSEPVE